MSRLLFKKWPLRLIWFPGFSRKHLPNKRSGHDAFSRGQELDSLQLECRVPERGRSKNFTTSGHWVINIILIFYLLATFKRRYDMDVKKTIAKFLRCIFIINICMILCFFNVVCSSEWLNEWMINCRLHVSFPSFGTWLLIHSLVSTLK